MGTKTGIQDEIEGMERQEGQPAEAGMLELADKLKELREKKKMLEDQVKANNAEIDSIEEQLVQSMLDEEMQNFNRAGTLFYLNTKVFASAVPEKKAELYEALKENGFADVVVETVNSQTLSGLVKEQIAEIDEIDDNGKPVLPEWLNGLVSTYEKQSIGMRKSSK